VDALLLGLIGGEGFLHSGEVVGEEAPQCLANRLTSSHAIAHRRRPAWWELLAGLGRDAGPDRAGNAGSAEAAITLRVLGEVLLVVILGKVEGRPVDDLGGDLAVALPLQLLFVGRLDGFRDPALLGIGNIDAGPVLGADVVALAHPLRR